MSLLSNWQSRSNLEEKHIPEDRQSQRKKTAPAFEDCLRRL
jgi:hypothetical protein